MVSFLIADVVSAGARVSLMGYVDESFSYSTMASISSNLSSNVFCVRARFFNFSSMAGSVDDFDLVFREVLPGLL
mgnify:CR=1 FL=1